jgi:ribosomal protein S3
MFLILAHPRSTTLPVCFCAGEKGRRIRELTSVVQKRFKFPVDSVELYAEKVADRGLCAVAQAESLRYKLLGGLAVRRCGSNTASLFWA